MLSPAKQDRDNTVPPLYDTTVIRGSWCAVRSDGSKVLRAGSPEGLQSAIAVDRGKWRRPRIPLSRPDAA